LGKVKPMRNSHGKAMLLIGHDPEHSLLIRSMFNDQALKDFELTCVECMSKAEQYLTGHSVDIVLLDLGLPDPKGLESFRQIRVMLPRISIVLLFSLDDGPTAVRAMQEGANDYFIKGRVDSNKLGLVLSNALERRAIEQALFNDRNPAQ